MRGMRLAVAAVAVASMAAVGTAQAAQHGGHGKPARAMAALATTSTSSVDAGRPVPTHFGIGVQADTSVVNGWMGRVAVPWDYAYRYIGGGINTGGTRNWTQWGSGNGTYPITYAQAARSHGYTPVFSYYSINAEVGPCSLLCGEARQDLTNLNTPAAMALYYNDFATLMKRLGTGTYDDVAGYGHDAIVHVEPDLSGYAEAAVLTPSQKCFGFCSGAGNDPSLLRASVASSGYPAAAAYPNTYRGFNEALLHLRDLYAPNVRLAFHVSDWATGWDINSATGTSIDANALGTEAGRFAAASGTRPIDGSTSTYDLVFNDVSNKDAAYYTYVLNKPRFWDQDNLVFPNFHRWEDYVHAVTTAAGRPAIVWQVPVGNQVSRSENNTPGHYQDNRVQYFFGHLGELRAAGIVGLLFGTTNPHATTFTDRAGDGVTNPLPTCTSDGWSSGFVACTAQGAAVSDDDGGYLRQQVRAYYQSPLALG